MFYGGGSEHLCYEKNESGGFNFLFFLFFRLIAYDMGEYVSFVVRYVL